MTYRYDFFVSYRRSYERNGRRHETLVSAWVKQLFYPSLCDLWNEERPGEQIFLDVESIPAGSSWPDYLLNAIRESRCLLPIWSPPYFQSRWCRAEWDSMTLRERGVGMNLGSGQGLVVPVLFHDGDSFPNEAQRTQQHDFKSFSHLSSGDPGIHELKKRLRDELLPSLLAALRRVPTWKPDFPLAKIEDQDQEPPIAFHGMTGGPQ